MASMTTAERIIQIRIPLKIEAGAEEDLLNYLMDQVIDIAKSTIYPFEDTSLITLPEKYDGWTMRACVQLYNHMGQDGVKSYSENGLTITYDFLQNGISSSTLAELTPRIGTPS